MEAACTKAEQRTSFAVFVRVALLLLAAVAYALHFLHLQADFPNQSPWSDWSKYTDEGWYGDAAIRHFVLGHWYVRGDFNPGVAVPVWPFLEALVFRFTGVSLAAARALTLCVFGVTLAALYALIARYPRRSRTAADTLLAASLAVFLLCLSPFFYAFERLAILEPPLAMFAVLALWTASHQEQWIGVGLERRALVRAVGGQWLLGLLMTAMVLTKTTALALMPAILYLLWAKAGYRPGSAVRLCLLPVGIAFGLWLAYLILLVRPHYAEDYAYLFAANAYTGFQLQPLATVLTNTFADGRWMGGVLYPAFFVLMLFALFGRPAFFANPLVPALLLWAGGYFLFLAYHNNLQPRYYLVLAVPVTALVAMALDEFRFPARVASRRTRFPWWRPTLLTLVALAIVVPDLLLQLTFLLHPEYTYLHAAQAIAEIVRADPTQPSLLLSVSGSDLTLMTGVPSIDDDFGTLDLDERVRQYHPGWYVAWNQIDDDKMDALTPLYRPVRVASFPALDDPDRDQLILYRLDPAAQGRARRKKRGEPPRPLRTRLGQQPTTTQLQH